MELSALSRLGLDDDHLALEIPGLLLCLGLFQIFAVLRGPLGLLNGVERLGGGLLGQLSG